MMRRLALLLALAAGPALAQDAELDALRLADEAQAEVARTSDWSAFIEGAAGRTFLRNGATSWDQRLSLDVQLDKRVAPGWRVVFADRLDLFWQDEPARQHGINTLKEAYLGWQARDDLLVDLGRINVRNGVATGYNPTDYFRTGANRSIISADPASLKKNRQGSVMLRGQALWDSGSVTGLVSPKLASQSNPAALNPDVGATNNRDRWLLAFSQKLSDGFSPQWLLYKEEGLPAQAGFNLSLLVNDSTVAHVEWSGGRSPSVFAQATQIDDTAFRNRLSAGLTYTAASKLSVTVEAQYNGAGLRDDEWSALPRTAPLAYARYRTRLQALQEMPTRKSVFLYVSWQDALIRHLDLNAMVRHNLADRSRLSWLEARYHLDRADLALQWQLNSGTPFSEFGAAGQRRAIQALARFFF
ncbi:hypothetical protein [Noviherbaspirillum sp. ST9]|uniref:hypothetical protein n=1 Tax=Noviherbaspirillum sp. ST9 TaxID=3401606 RepID=UPI003B585C03